MPDTTEEAAKIEPVKHDVAKVRTAEEVRTSPAMVSYATVEFKQPTVVGGQSSTKSNNSCTSLKTSTTQLPCYSTSNQSSLETAK